MELKTCHKCKKEKTISEFSLRTDTLKYRNECTVCKYEREKEWKNINREKFNEYNRKRRETDANFRLINNTRWRMHHALKGESKSSSTKDILGIDIETYKQWIEFQMTPEMNFHNTHLDHVRPISSFDVSKDDELKEAFNWVNTQPLFKGDNLKKGSKYDFLDYRLQFIKAYQFLKLNEERQ